MSVQLFQYQIDALENLPKNVILAWDTGVGKTYGALEHYRRWSVYRDGNGEYTRHIADATTTDNVPLTPRTPLLIVAPASKVRTGDWEDSAKKYFGDDFTVTVISYEAMSKRYKEFDDPDLTIIADECHFLCNATSKRSRAFLKITAVAKQWIGLSATPLPNGWRSAETYAVLTGLSRTKTEFVNQYVIIDRSKGFPLILGYRDKDVLTNWWSKVSKPLPRTGDLILPSQNIPVHITMKPGLARTYKKALKERLYEDEPLDSPSKVFATLRQIPATARVEALQSIIDGTGEHVIVFYNFNNERDAIRAMLEKSFKGRKIYEQSGHESSIPKREKWATLPSSVTLVQYQSGSQAIELTYASITVYFSPPTSYSNYEQSRGRNLRHGQEKLVLFYHIAVADSLDRRIWQILAEKRDFSTALMLNLLQSIDNT